MMEDMAKNTAATPVAAPEAVGTAAPAGDSFGAFSETNIQVAGVDEPEIVKTDGRLVYFYNDKEHRVYIALAAPAKDLTIVKSIVVPSNWQNAQIFIQGKKLVVLATKYQEYSLNDYAWFNWSQKTVVAVYDLSDIKNLRIDRYYQIDGSILQSRKVGRYLYVLSENNFHFPYAYYGPMPMAKMLPGAVAPQASMSESDLIAKFQAENSLPKKLEIRRTPNAVEQNYVHNGKRYAYNLVNSAATTCDDIEYVLPDEATMDKYNFSPNFVVLSMIDLDDASQPAKTKVLFGDVSEIHMGLDKATQTSNLYITSSLYTASPFRCPAGAYCLMPYFEAGENTLIHKLTISGLSAAYQTSTIIPGTPLNQYSMDEDASGNFRIITSRWNPERNTNLYILDSDMKLAGKLENIAPKENFQSSRFIGDRLYLVTFQQIDPLFVVDVGNPTDPKILGELKMPGYSTYLHPYDANHLIGIGYDTQDSGHGGVMNGGLKVDLYDVSDLKNPRQQYSLTLGDNGSTSDALSNPRMFTWYADKKLLLLPATLYKSANDPQNTWRHADAWQGTLAIGIDASAGIETKGKVTHIDRGNLDAKRQAECAQYKTVEKPVCKKLVGGGEYCPPVTTWVPEYCYADSSAGEYFANQIWNWNDNFILRNLYIGDTLYTLSNTKIQANSLIDYSKIQEANWK